MNLSSLRKGITAAAASALLLAVPATAFAQGYPGYNSGYAPGYNDGGYHPRFEQMTGVVTSFDRFDLYVRTADGRDRYVRLHQGTIINPTGITLHPGMLVNVAGVRADGALQANRIDVQHRAWRRY